MSIASAKHMDSVAEIWKEIPGWEGLYEASHLGRIRSIKRKGVIPLPTGGIREYGGSIVVPFKKPNRYLYVNLTMHGIRIQQAVHRLVLLAFTGSPADGHECCHNNGVRTDNRAANLRWDTRKNNHADKLLHGTAPRQIAKRRREERECR